MDRINWHRMFISAALLSATLFPVGMALAANPTHGGDLVPSCLQSLKENLGAVSPGSWVESPAIQCDRAASADAGLIPATGGVRSSVSWSDAGANLYLGRGGSSGWRDAGAGSR